jgi:hypothetical protein
MAEANFHNFVGWHFIYESEIALLRELCPVEKLVVFVDGLGRRFRSQRFGGDMLRSRLSRAAQHPRSGFKTSIRPHMSTHVREKQRLSPQKATELWF